MSLSLDTYTSYLVRIWWFIHNHGVIDFLMHILANRCLSPYYAIDSHGYIYSEMIQLSSEELGA